MEKGMENKLDGVLYSNQRTLNLYWILRAIEEVSDNKISNVNHNCPGVHGLEHMGDGNYKVGVVSFNYIGDSDFEKLLKNMAQNIGQELTDTHKDKFVPMVAADTHTTQIVHSQSIDQVSFEQEKFYSVYYVNPMCVSAGNDKGWFNYPGAQPKNEKPV